MKVLVTGAAGFIAHHFCNTLTGAGYEVTGLDVHRPRTEGIAWHTGSVCDQPLVHELVRQHDAVVHLASIVGYAHVMADIENSVHTTTVGTSHVTRACIAHRVPMLFTSTSAVYGHGSRSDSGAREEDHLKLGPTTTPSWAYAYAKAAAECQVLAAHRELRLQATVVRLFNVVGPGQSAAAGFVLPRFVRSALRQEPLKVYSPGTQTRTFAHVADISEGLLACLQRPAAVGQVMNLGGTTTIPIQELAQRVNSVLHNPSGWVLTPAPYQGYEEIRERRPDLTKAQLLLDYRPTKTLDEMIRDTAEAVAPEVLV